MVANITRNSHSTDNVLVAAPTSKSQAELGKELEAEVLDSLTSNRRNL